METKQLLEALEELEKELRSAAERNDAKSEGAGERALLYAGQANAYEHSAEKLADVIRYAREW